jgi:PadR family transcriptional regulator PadR
LPRTGGAPARAAISVRIRCAAVNTGQIRLERARRKSALAAGLDVSLTYVAMTSINARMLDRELKKGSAELIILSIVESRARHGYEISKLIETRSEGQLKFHVASLYPLLYRLEERGWLQGRWVEKSGERRRRFYSLTAEGRRVVTRQRETWKVFVHAMGLITGGDHA